MRINNSSVFSQIKLGENAAVPKRVQVLRVGKFNHPKYGTFEITKRVLAEMKSNFDLRVRGIDTAFDYYHDSDQDASAWVNSLDLAEGGNELWADVDWTPKAEKKLAERELRYFSPDFVFTWKDPESGKTHNNVLFGGGLTNRPFVKEMQPIVADEKNLESEGTMKTVAELEAEIVGLKAQIVTLGEQKNAATNLQLAESKTATDLKAEVEKLKGENKTLSEAKVEADKKAATAAKESEFNVLLSEGKACVAQKEAFLAGDMTAFIKLAQPVNTKAKGSSASATEDVDADEDDKIIKLAEEMEKADPSLDRGASISKARKQIKAEKK